MPLLAVLIVMADPGDAREEAERRNRIEPLIAEAVAASMPDLRYPWQLEWRAFGTYASREIRWHLTPARPGYERNPPPEGVTRRTGWISNGATASVAVCGDDEEVGAMMIETSDLWLGDGDLAPELAALGVSATLVESQAHHPITLAQQARADGWPDWARSVSDYPGYRVWRLQREGREPVLLTASYICTPPGTRHATHCSMAWTVEYRPASERRSEPCLPGERPRGQSPS